MPASTSKANDARPLADAALGYAKRGRPIIPLHPGRKDPIVQLVPHGCKDATTDVASVAQWWGAWPDANIGLACGHGITVLDVDRRSGGEETLARLQAAHGELPATLTVRTGDGYHLYYAAPTGTRGRELGPGVSYRGAGLYVVAPPSLHPSGARYTWANEMPIAPAPGWLQTATNSHRHRAEPVPEILPEGTRNTTLASVAGSMRRRGAAEVAILAALRAINSEQCRPPLDDAEVRKIAASVARYEPENEPRLNIDRGAANVADAKPAKKSQADHLVDLASAAVLFHDPDGDGYATIPVDGHKETWLLKSKGFRRWLAGRFHAAHDKAPGAQAMQDALCVLEGQALFTGPEHSVFTRLAWHEGKIYLDLADETWQAVEIGPDGWHVVSDPPVRFRRAKGMQPIPTPKRGGSVDDLRPFVNLATDADWRLYVAWLLAAFRPTGPYPILCVHGEQGSAKTTLSRVARRLIDPNGAPLRSEPREVRDIMIAARNGWIVGYDNLSRLPDWLSDALCRLSTGGGFSTRELYSDSDEILFEAQRPVALNGIEELATRADLLDRAIILYLAAIPEEKRRPESVFWKDFETAQPGILGALLNVVSQALKRLPDTKLQKLPRMADFALWGTAAEEALGWAEGSFMAAYTQNRGDANDLALEAAPVAEAVQYFLTGRQQWLGTSSELLAELNLLVDEEKRKSNERRRLWPTSPRHLSNTLRRVAPNLKVAGVHIVFDRTNTRRTIQLEKGCIASSQASPASRGDENPRRDAENRSDDEMARGHLASPFGNSSSPKNSLSWRGKPGRGDASDGGDDGLRTHSISCADCGEPAGSYR